MLANWEGGGTTGSAHRLSVERTLGGRALEVVRPTDGLLIEKTEYAAGTTFSPHHHEGHLFSWVVEGAFFPSSTGVASAVSAGESWLCPAEMRHSARSLQAAPTRVLNVEASPGWLAHHFGAAEPHWFQGGRERVGVLARELHRELMHRDDVFVLSAQGLVLRILAEILRAGRRADGGRPPWVDSLLDLGRDCYRSPPTLQELSGELGVSQTEICRVFKDHTGLTFGQYVREIRAQRARELLERTDRSLSAIAYASGYADQSHFTRQFKEHFGLPPGRFRNRMTG